MPELGTWTLTIDTMGRPWLANQAHRMHYRTASKVRKQWSNAAIQHVRLERVPRLERIGLTVWCRYPTMRSLPDPDACAPSMKAVIDGLVRAGVIPDDKGAHVAHIDYLPPEVVAGCLPALIVQIDAYPTIGDPK